jgi:hypothetical protein
MGFCNVTFNLFPFHYKGHAWHGMLHFIIPFNSLLDLDLDGGTFALMRYSPIGKKKVHVILKQSVIFHKWVSYMANFTQYDRLDYTEVSAASVKYLMSASDKGLHCTILSEKQTNIWIRMPRPYQVD